MRQSRRAAVAALVWSGIVLPVVMLALSVGTGNWRYFAFAVPAALVAPVPGLVLLRSAQARARSPH